MRSVRLIGAMGIVVLLACGSSEPGGVDVPDAAGGAAGSAGSAGSGATAGHPPAGEQLDGDSHAGEYHLGPVEWDGAIHNSCAPYTADIEAREGNLLAGLGLAYNGQGQLCDAC